MSKEESKAMADYIYKIIYLTEPVIYWSWGVSEKYVIDKGLRIKVKGCHHEGFVDIVYDEGYDAFTVKIVKFNEEVIDTISNVYLDNLQEVIDNRIERVSDYKI